jgi:hypothetical protein
MSGVLVVHFPLLMRQMFAERTFRSSESVRRASLLRGVRFPDRSRQRKASVALFCSLSEHHVRKKPKTEPAAPNRAHVLVATRL